MVNLPQAADHKTPERIGIVLDGFVALSGARDFIVSLVDAADRARADREIVLIFRTSRILPLGPHLNRLFGTRARDAKAKALLKPLHDAGLLNQDIIICDRTNHDLERICAEYKIDVVGPLNKVPRKPLRVPWFGYLYDFQHKYLTHFFTDKKRNARDTHFYSMLNKAGAVVVNAAEVKCDAEKFFPNYSTNVVPLSFSAAPRENWFQTDTTVMRAKYGVGKRYFIVSNQFWLHKNHETVIQAFCKLSQSYKDIELVLTGDTRDQRSPTRLKDIKSLIAELEISDKVHILGLIPKLEQVALLRSAIAVVQATSFEGGPGGGSVFDGISLGVPTIVSDIPVNREIAHLVDWYFALNDIDDLSKKMIEALLCPQRTVSSDLLMQKGLERRVSMGHDVWHAARQAYLQKTKLS